MIPRFRHLRPGRAAPVRKFLSHIRAYLFLSAVSVAGLSGQDTSLGDPVRNRIEAGLTRGEFTAAGEGLLARRALPEFYLNREFREVWLDAEDPGSAAQRFMDFLRLAYREGLTAEDYHLTAIDSLRSHAEESPEAELLRRVDLELLLTDAYLVFGSHLLQGRVDPVSINPVWLANRRSVNMAQVLSLIHI